MADIQMPRLEDYGALLSSYGNGLANQDNAAANVLNARASVPGKLASAAATQASIPLTNAQTAAAQLANDKTQIQLQWMRGMLAPPVINNQEATSNTSTADATTAPRSSAPGAVKPEVDPTSQAAGDDGSDATSVAHFGLDPQHIDSHVAQTFAVPDTWTPQEMQQLQQAAVAKSVGLPDLTDSIKLQHEARITTATQQAQNVASKAYDNANAVYTAPPGRAFDVLNAMNETAAEGFRKVADAKGWSDEKLDAYVRTYAGEMGNAVHKYSGRDIEVGKDGVARDKVTQLPVLGANPAGLSASEHASIMKDAQTLVEVPQSDGSTIKQPQWKALGYTSPVAFTNAAGSRDDGTAPPAPRTPVPGRDTPVVPPGQQSQTSDPVLRQALSDPDFKAPNAPVKSGSSPSLEQQKVIPARAQAGLDLSKDSGDATAAAAQSLQYMQAAKNILDAKGTNVGSYGGLLAKASALLGDYKGDASDYAELAKYLGNAALAQAKGIYGQRMTQSEVGLQLNELSPSVKMTPQAVRELLNTNIASAKYTIDSATRARQFLASGGDPLQFPQWQEKYFPRADAVNGSSGSQPNRPGQTTGGNAPAAGTIRGGYRFAGGDPANKNNWVKQ